MDAEIDTSANQGRTASREVRRRQLIDATIDSIAERGFSGTTLAAVTKGANLSHGIVNFYFKNKETLFVETLGLLAQEHYDCWQAAINMAGSEPSKRLKAIIEVDFERDICSPKKLAVWFAFWGQAKYRPNYIKIHDGYDKQRSDEIERLCRLIVEDGGYEHPNPASSARSIVALVDGLWLSLLLYPNSTHRKEALNDCLAFLVELFPKHFPLLVGTPT
jgi:TetR/AcrR family transcriptional repressor of bet genes